MSTKSILDMIRDRQNGFDNESQEEKERRLFEESMYRAPVSADDWQEFKRKFVEEYGSEKVKADGMTHSEFLQYLKDSTREGDEYIQRQTLRDFLRKL